MKERYSRFMDNIAPEKSDEELFSAVLAKAEKKKNIKTAEKKILKKAVVVPVAAAAALFLSIGGGAAIYSGLSYLRQSEIAQSPEVAQNIQTEVFSDSTEHIKMTVEEYVSDGISAYATVKYEALDETGKEWLSYKNFDNNLLCLKPCSIKYGSKYAGISHSYGNFEIEEMRTESERYFYIELQCASDGYDGGISLIYSTGMGGSLCEQPMEKCTVETKVFTLSSSEQASEYFTPTHLKISDISFVVYGKNHGAYKKTSHSITCTIPEDDRYKLHEIMKPTPIMSDGERIEASASSILGSSTPREDNLYTDYIVCAGDFSKYDYEKEKWIYYAINSDDITGIEICGVYFEATEIE